MAATDDADATPDAYADHDAHAAHDPATVRGPWLLRLSCSGPDTPPRLLHPGRFTPATPAPVPA